VIVVHDWCGTGCLAFGSHARRSLSGGCLLSFPYRPRGTSRRPRDAPKWPSHFYIGTFRPRAWPKRNSRPTRGISIRKILYQIGDGPAAATPATASGTGVRQVPAAAGGFLPRRPNSVRPSWPPWLNDAYVDFMYGNSTRDFAATQLVIAQFDSQLIDGTVRRGGGDRAGVLMGASLTLCFLSK